MPVVRRTAAPIAPAPGSLAPAPPAPSLVLGIDPSLTSTGYCFVYQGTARDTGVIGTSPLDPRPYRCLTIRDQLLARFHSSWHGRLLVAMEGEVWVAGHQAFEQSALQAVLQVAFYERVPRPDFLVVNVGYVKQWVGAREKDQILLQVYKRYQQEFRSHDQADAFIVAMIAEAFARHRAGMPNGCTKEQTAILDRLCKGPQGWDMLKRRAKERRGR